MVGIRTVEEVAAASQGAQAKYEIVTYRGVKILMPRTKIEHAVEVTHELTHQQDVEQLAKDMGITLRKFR